jgi:hypothetical protein
MTTTIYTTAEALATVLAIKDLDYYDRCSLSDNDATDLTHNAGYYLKNANKLNWAALPDDSAVVARVLAKDQGIYAAHVSIPANLRGCIFENAPNLPPLYKQIIEYWSGEPLNTNAGGAAYYQNPMNAYEIDLSPLDAEHEAGNFGGNVAAIDALLSEGVVVSIIGLGSLTRHAGDDDFVEVEIPIDGALLFLDNPDFRTQRAYNRTPSERTERIFLKVADIRKSPDPARIFVDALRYEELDYGFYY